MTDHQWNHGFQVGDHVAVTSSKLDIVDDSGLIRDVDHENGDLIILLDRIVPALECWHNQVPVNAGDAGALKRIGRMWSVR